MRPTYEIPIMHDHDRDETVPVPAWLEEIIWPIALVGAAAIYLTGCWAVMMFTA
jgi:hypothetical protein